MNIKIGNYNILHCRDYLHCLATGEERRSPERIAEIIAELGLDVCGLNEVYNQEMLEGDEYINQARAIADKLGYYFYFAKAIDYRGFEYGNALVSRFPIVSAKTVPMALPENAKKKPRYEDRAILIAELDTGDKPFTVAVSHFGLSPEEHELDVDIAISELSAVEGPLVFMGDLNMMPHNPLIAKLSDVLNDTALLTPGDNFTFCSDKPFEKIDYIFTNNAARALSFKVSDAVFSDHLPVTAEIEI